ncbi:hypothetical protein FHS85_004321 [Rhodoligotrophos appendicifer]
MTRTIYELGRRQKTVIFDIILYASCAVVAYGFLTVIQWN